jgi:peptide/nickel transport system permease protein
MIRGLDRSGRVAAGFLLALGVVAAFAPLITNHDPLSGVLAESHQGPSWEHWLGTDNLGRDEFTRLVYGARITLGVGMGAVVIALLIGVPIGLIAGYHGGWADRITMRGVEIVVSVPAVVVAIAVAGAAGPGVVPAALALGFVAATIMARLARNVVVAAREEDYLDGARVTGVSHRRVIVRHLLPNVAPPIIVQTTLLFAAAVLAEAALSFLGLGAVPPAPSWGVMLDQARADFEDAPWLAVWPGLCIFLTVLAFNRLGDSSRDLFDRDAPNPLDQRPIEPTGQADGTTASSPTSPALALRVRDLSVTFPGPAGPTVAVSDVSLSLRAGEVLGVIGESGAGKTTLGLAVLGLVPPPGRVTATSITIADTEVVGLPTGKFRQLRGRTIGLIAQDPVAALDPSYTVGHQLAEPLRWHFGHSRRAARLEAAELLERVGIADNRLDDYPHQFSGGQAQRIGIAMALACRPAVLIADEPTTALDGVVQAEVLDLLLDLRTDLGMALLLISHDLGVVAGVADRVAVMQRGRIVESAETSVLFARPRNPYTAHLISAARLDARSGETTSAAPDFSPIIGAGQR